MSTNLSITSLLSTILASWVLQRVELTTVAVYPAAAVPNMRSLMAVPLLFLRIKKAEGMKMLKKVA
jgi:hypothetical protein